MEAPIHSRDIKTAMTTFKSFDHPANCECNQAPAVSNPSSSSIVLDIIIKVAKGFVIAAFAFLVVYVGYQFFTA